VDENRIEKRIPESNIIGKRPGGKTRERWVNAIDTESKEILKVSNWKRESLDREFGGVI
jgi:hypothetical protein